MRREREHPFGQARVQRVKRDQLSGGAAGKCASSRRRDEASKRITAESPEHLRCERGAEARKNVARRATQSALVQMRRERERLESVVRCYGLQVERAFSPKSASSLHEVAKRVREHVQWVGKKYVRTVVWRTSSTSENVVRGHAEEVR